MVIPASKLELTSTDALVYHTNSGKYTRKAWK